MLRLHLLLLVAVSAAHGFEDGWRSKCSLLGDRRTSPFVYFSQAEVAVIAHYSGLDFNAFRRRQKIEFDITPVCFAKGYVATVSMRVVSGNQKCPVTPLPEYMQYPALFFLRRVNGSDQQWELLNGGEFPHRSGTKGLLFGNGAAGEKFLTTCGLQRTRIAVDATACTVADCRSYCTYDLPPRAGCVTPLDGVRRNAPGTQLPPDVPPYDASTMGQRPRGGAGRPEGMAMLLVSVALALRL